MDGGAPSWGVVLLPCGVASRSCGGAGREAGRWSGCNSGILLLPTTGLWLGEGGIARPSLGVRAPPVLRFEPGMGGRRSGAGDDMVLGGG